MTNPVGRCGTGSHSQFAMGEGLGFSQSVVGLGGVKGTRDVGPQDISLLSATLHLLNMKGPDNAIYHEFWKGRNEKCVYN